MRHVLLVGAITLTSCGYRSGPLPDGSEIIRVEQALAKAPCIGNINDWGRTYQYHLNPNELVGGGIVSWLDRDVIDFDLGKGFGPGAPKVRRRPPYPPLKYIIDELSMARGSYNLRSGVLKFQFCETTRR